MHSTILAHCIVDELVRCGLRLVVLSPGSRSTPLALAFAAQPDIVVRVSHDERGAAFEALGAAKGTGRPTAVLCTSGTAAANLYPAICEARASHVPLLALTADRPPQEQDAGTPQTMPQDGLFGSMVTHARTLTADAGGTSSWRALRAAVCQAWWRTTHPEPGPIHLNIPFSKPLEPATPLPLRYGPEADQGLRGRAEDRPWTLHGSMHPREDEALHRLRALLHEAHRPLVLAGPSARPCRTLPAFAAAWKLPVWAEALSGLRGTGFPILEYGDVILRHPSLPAALRPDLVVRIGATSTGMPLLRWLEETDLPMAVIAPFTARSDPDHRSGLTLHGDPDELLSALGTPGRVADRDAWIQALADLDRCAGTRMREVLDAGPFFEGQVAHVLSDAIPDATRLLVSSSMPVRDLETYFHPSHPSSPLLFNRGVNGIDGIVSTALGASVAGDPVWVLIGDVALVHDLNALTRLARHRVVLFVLNNDGGQIFGHLPVATQAEFTRLFRTPHGISFARLARALDCPHLVVEDAASLALALHAAREAEGPLLVEVKTDFDESRHARTAVVTAIAEALPEVLPEYRTSESEILAVRTRAGATYNAEALLLLHGFSKDGRSWKNVESALPEYRLLLPDLPGHGGTPRFECPDPVDRFQELGARLLDREAVESVTLVGYSMGGRLALLWAAAAPHRFRRLALISTRLGWGEDEDPRQRAEADAQRAQELEEEGLEAFVQRWEKMPVLREVRPRTSDERQTQRELRRAQRVEGLAWALRHLGPGVLPDPALALSSLTMPLLLMVGEDDARTRADAERVAATRPNTTLVVLPKAGHDLPGEAPEDVAQALREWMTETDETDASR